MKPQFEVGPKLVEKGGVVRDPTARREAIDRVRRFVEGLGLTCTGVIDAPISGPAGNLEALLVARR